MAPNTTTRSLLTLLTAASLLTPTLLNTRHAHATSASWLTPTSGNWTDPTKWSTQPLYPSDNTYDASLAATGAAYTVTLSPNLSINNLTLNSPNATLYQNQTNASALTLSGTLNVQAGTYTLYNGTLAGGTLQASGGNIALGTQNGQTSLRGTTLSGPISTSGTLNVSNDLALNGGTLTLNGYGNQVRSCPADS